MAVMIIGILEGVSDTQREKKKKNDNSGF